MARTVSGKLPIHICCQSIHPEAPCATIKLYVGHDLSWCLRTLHFLFPSPWKVPHYSTYDTVWYRGPFPRHSSVKLLEGEDFILFISIMLIFNMEGTNVFNWVNRWRLESLSVGKTGFERLDCTWLSILICCRNTFSRHSTKGNRSPRCPWSLGIFICWVRQELEIL